MQDQIAHVGLQERIENHPVVLKTFEHGLSNWHHGSDKKQACLFLQCPSGLPTKNLDQNRPMILDDVLIQGLQQR